MEGLASTAGLAWLAALFVVVAVGCGIVFYFVKKKERAEHQLRQAQARLHAIRDVEERYRAILDLESAIRGLAQQRDAAAQEFEQEQRRLSEQRAAMASEIDRLRHELDELTAEEYFAGYGLYEPKFDFEDAEDYKDALQDIRERQKEMVKEGRAAVCSQTWTVEGSAAKGRKMVREQLKLMLLAFNGECDSLIAKVKYNNVSSIEQRIIKARERLNKLGSTKDCAIQEDYLRSKLDELCLFHEYQEKKQEEKEEQRRIKEQMREEKRAREELMRAQKQAEEEERRYEESLKKAREEVERATGKKHEKLRAQIEELERRLTEAHENKERAVSRAQMTRSGHVYVISNVGSFGEDIYKIGMTRRLDPMDRVKELGDASVPFSFDVHAIIFSEDAPGLETALHQRFQERRVNLVNERKEFFRVPLSEVSAAVHELHGEIEFTKLAEAAEYRKTLAKLGLASGRKAPSTVSPGAPTAASVAATSAAWGGRGETDPSVGPA